MASTNFPLPQPLPCLGAAVCDCIAATRFPCYLSWRMQTPVLTLALSMKNLQSWTPAAYAEVQEVAWYSPCFSVQISLGLEFGNKNISKVYLRTKIWMCKGLNMAWVALKSRSVMVCRFWAMARWDSRKSHTFYMFFCPSLPVGPFFFLFNVKPVFSVLSDGCVLLWRCLCVACVSSICAHCHEESFGFPWHTHGHMLLIMSVGVLTGLCDQLCSSQNWEHWEEWCREAGQLLACVPACPGLYRVHVQAQLKTSLLTSCVPQWMLLFAYLPFFHYILIVCSEKNNPNPKNVQVIFPVLHPLCRKSSIMYMWETRPSPLPHFLAHSLEELYYLEIQTAFQEVVFFCCSCSWSEEERVGIGPLRRQKRELGCMG